MKLALSWLANYLEHECPISDIVDKLTCIGFEVESISDDSFLGGFTVVEVLELYSHPNADNLKICKVFNGESVIDVVCGALNVFPGMKSVLANVGAVIPATGAVIASSNIRGFDSFGMLCSKKELGMYDSMAQEGIIDLSDDYLVGESFFSLDKVIDVNVTMNRGDCLGVYGIARELFASGIGKLKPLRDVKFSYSDDLPDPNLDIDLEMSCAFLGRCIRGVKNRESPKWLNSILCSVGITPVSFVVDVCNYVMITLNQPIFVYDLESLKRKLVLDKLKDTISFTTPSDKEIIVHRDTTVIYDDQGNVHSIAGVVQSKKNFCSSLKEIDIFLTCSWLDPIDVAATARALNLVTDSSYRYERGVDYKILGYALDLASSMIIDYCSGIPSKVIFKEKSFDCNRVNQLMFDYKSVSKLGNLSIDSKLIESILNKLGFIIDKMSDVWKIQVPSWRYDIHSSIDIVEEVLRIYGYNNVKEESVDASPYNNDFIYDKLKSTLLVEGLDEVITWSFMSMQFAKKFGYKESELISIDNPINSNFNIMRPTLIPNLIQIVVDNIAKNCEEGYSFFEVGNVYRIINEEIVDECVVSGIRCGKNMPRNLHAVSRSFDIFDLKSDIINVLKIMNVDQGHLQLRPSENIFYHPFKSASVYIKENYIGHFGELHPKLVSYYGLTDLPMCFEIKFNSQLFFNKKADDFCDYKYQAVKRDFAFIISEDTEIGRLLKLIEDTNLDFVHKVTVFDLYKGEDIGKGKISVAFSVIFRSNKHTFGDTEIKKMSEDIVSSVIRFTGGVLR